MIRRFSFGTEVMRRFLQTVLPRRALADLERETRKWEIACPTCGRSKDLWVAGGVRYKARGRKRVLGRCSGCGGARRWLVIRRTDD